MHIDAADVNRDLDGVMNAIRGETLAIAGAQQFGAPCRRARPQPLALKSC
jgi:hypothetical protein